MSVLTLPAGTHNLTVRARALVFEDPRSREVLARIEQIAPSEATVLLTGETGTGKEIVARQVHQLSRRAAGPFIAVNCGAFSEGLVESELFGHEKGAFTGAVQAKAGWFEAARGGTLFLDEIGDLPLSLQVKLLRVLQESEVVRLGSRHAIPIDVRLIAATNVDLQEAMAAGHFREDLYYRLNVVSLTLPPLRDRPGDIPALARYFVNLYRKRLGLEEVELLPSALDQLLSHTWPGNLRELENTVHHALLVCRNSEIRAEDVRVTTPSAPPRSRPPSALSARSQPRTADETFEDLARAFEATFELGLPRLHERIEETLIRAAYNYSEKNQLQTARLLDVSRNIVRARLIHHGELLGRPRSTPPPSLDAPTDPTQGGPPASQRAPSRSRARPLRVGYQKFGQLLLVKALGALEQELAAQGETIEWKEYPGGLQLIAALQDDTLDVGVVGECPPVFAQAASVPIVYLAAEPAAPEAEAIIVPDRSPILRVADLRGKTIALNRGANVHYLLLRALEEAGLAYSDVKVAFLTPSEAKRAFASNAVDAWAIWDPLLSCAIHEQGARVLRDAQGLAENTAYYVARRKVAEGVPELLELVLEHVDRAAQFAREKPALAASIVSSEADLRPDTIEHWIRQLSGTTRIGDARLDAQQTVADVLFRSKLVPRAVRIADAQWRPRLAV
jgi:aliphatic sulfonates family ABC transporter substrate-binding protein